MLITVSVLDHFEILSHILFARKCFVEPYVPVYNSPNSPCTQGYLKTAEISINAYGRRPWHCPNITGTGFILTSIFDSF